jgi:hypothetical protein
MYDLKIDEEVFEELVVGYLKNQVSVVMQEFEHMSHPEDREYNTYLLPALLTVIKYFSIPNEYTEYIHQTFGPRSEEEIDDDLQQEFNFGGTDE